MKIMYNAKCKDCGEGYQSYCTLNEFEQMLIDEKCTSCGGQLTRDWSGGGHYMMKHGATRRPT